MALSNKQKRQIGDDIVDSIHVLIEFWDEKLEQRRFRNFGDVKSEEVDKYLKSLIKRIPNNIYKK